jgi:glycosyltransferase involved in cell wall biosynthesis
MGLPSAYILNRATAIVVPSVYFKRQLLDRHTFVDEDKVIISESAGFREDFFFPPKVLRSELNTHCDNLHFGYISRIDEGKGWELMLAAFALLKENNPTEYAKSKLSVYGSGAEVAVFNAMVLELKLNDLVTYYGPLPQYKLGDVYRSFDYFLFPTRRESFGLVAVEALACGAPVICSNIEPLTDVVKDSYNGYLFNDGSDKSLHEKLQYCFSIARSDYLKLTESSVLSVKHLGAKQVCKELHKELSKHFPN